MQPDTPTLDLGLPSGPVPLRFTWAALDSVGATGMAAALERARSPEPGAFDVLADLIVTAAGGAVDKSQVLATSPPYAEALTAVVTAYLHAMQGAPERRPWWRRVVTRS